uniref:HAUS augmin-like complex subunit 3 N-terminal domain-containing protein n=1 Tax=Athene cunicularia TaxID=194338 RepID=A0A663MGP2_ATHCN
MFSQRCFQAFPLHTVDRGAEFVVSLRLVYPHADTLCTKQFLEWFCSTVGEENVLSPAEVEAYDALLASGKPILEGNVLEQALQACCHVLQLPSTTVAPSDEGPSLEALQQELQDYRDCQLWQHNKVQVCAANLQQELKYLEEDEKVVKQDLRKAQMGMEVEILQTRAVLSQISKAAKHLAEWYGDMGKGWPPALLCEMDLGPYMELEQQATAVFERFTQQVLPGSVQAPDAQGDTKKTKMPKSLGTDGDEVLDDQVSFWKELSQMETAHICAQREVIVMSAKVEGHCAALEWAQRTLGALKEKQVGPVLFCLSLAVEACLFRLSILQRQFSLKAAHLQYVAGRQEEAVAWLASQHSSRLDLLALQLKREIKEMDQKEAWLGEMETAMREAQTRLQEQKDYFRDTSSCKKYCPCTWIDPRDPSLAVPSCRLWDMLMGQDQKKQILRSYKAMVALCSQLVQDQRVLEFASGGLHVHMCLGSAPQEITEMIQQLITMQDNLYQMLTDLLSDLKAKRRSLGNPILQTECKLYVYFYCDEDRLREVVEHLEKQVSAFCPPLRELPYAEE